MYSGLSKASIMYPDVYKELLRLGKDYVCNGHDFNSIHINHNLTCPSHIDDNNVGKSILVSIGDYTGSLLVVNANPFDLMVVLWFIIIHLI